MTRKRQAFHYEPKGKAPPVSAERILEGIGPKKSKRPIVKDAPILAGLPQPGSNVVVDDATSECDDNSMQPKYNLPSIKLDVDHILKQYGITSKAAKREVLARIYDAPAPAKSSPESALVRNAPDSLQPHRPYTQGREISEDDVKAARQVANRYSYQQRKGKTFTDEEMEAVRAAWRIIGTAKQAASEPAP